jgi:hypothetical protein
MVGGWLPHTSGFMQLPLCFVCLFAYFVSRFCSFRAYFCMLVIACLPCLPEQPCLLALLTLRACSACGLCRTLPGGDGSDAYPAAMAALSSALCTLLGFELLIVHEEGGTSRCGDIVCLSVCLSVTVFVTDGWNFGSWTARQDAGKHCDDERACMKAKHPTAGQTDTHAPSSWFSGRGWRWSCCAPLMRKRRLGWTHSALQRSWSATSPRLPTQVAPTATPRPHQAPAASGGGWSTTSCSGTSALFASSCRWLLAGNRATHFFRKRAFGPVSCIYLFVYMEMWSNCHHQCSAAVCLSVRPSVRLSACSSVCPSVLSESNHLQSSGSPPTNLLLC